MGERMKDITGKELSVGDIVVCIPQNGYTDALDVGEILGFTPKKVLINLTKRCFPYGNPTVLKYPVQVAKV